MLSLIVAAARGGAIGEKGRMPWHIPADLKYFKRVTMGKPVVMGRKTYVSMGKALPGRENIVISRSVTSLPDARCAGSLGEALALCDGAPEIMVIGGGEIYEAAMALADRLYVTDIELDAPGADRFFPAIDASHWQQTDVTTRAQDGETPALHFRIYDRRR